MGWGILEHAADVTGDGVASTFKTVIVHPAEETGNAEGGFASISGGGPENEGGQEGKREPENGQYERGQEHGA